jgi:hypothetical protein
LALHKYKIEDRRRRVASFLVESKAETEIADDFDQDLIYLPGDGVGREHEQFEVAILPICPFTQIRTNNYLLI